jgi:membrane-associated phospholipid phosphatase
MAFLGVVLISTLGCGTLAGGKKWGEDATLWPGWERVGKAALYAAVSPGTLAPAAGALIFQADGSDHLSFPSGDAARAAVLNTLADRNLECLDLPGWTRTSAAVGLYALTATTAWSRLEARRHYPSDVLAGMALGHFFGAFVNDAFLGVREPRWFFAVEPGRREVFLTLHQIF